MEWLYDFLAGTVTGILSGFGLGGGTLLLLYMTAVRGFEQHLAQGINLLYFLPAALASLPAHLKNDYVDRKTVYSAVSAGLVTTMLAAWFSTGLNVALLRKCFGVFLIIIGLSEFHQKKGEHFKKESQNEG